VFCDFLGVANISDHSVTFEDDIAIINDSWNFLEGIDLFVGFAFLFAAQEVDLVIFKGDLIGFEEVSGGCAEGANVIFIEVEAFLCCFGP